MFCIQCGRLQTGGRFCAECGSPTSPNANESGNAQCTPTPPDARGLPRGTVGGPSLAESQFRVRAGAVTCGLLALVQLAAPVVLADGATKLACVVGAVICAVIAWKLWARSSVAAAVAALIMLSLQGAGLLLSVLAVAVTSTDKGSSINDSWLVMVSIFMVVVGYLALRSALQIRRTSST